MNKAIKILALVLVAQLVVILGLNLGTGKQQANEPKLLLPDIAGTDTLILSDSDNESTELRKSAAGWIMPGYGNLSVTEGKVDELLEKFKAAKVLWPVATTDAASKRFEVSQENAQKTLIFKKGDSVVATLYLGTSPSYRRLHARLENSKDIHTIELAHHELPATAAEWLDKTLLQVEGEVTSVKTDLFRLTRDSSAESDRWLVSPSPEGEVDEEAVGKWAKRFNNLIVSKLVPEAEVEAVIVQNPVTTIHVNTADSDLNYAFYRQNDTLYVKQFGDSKLFEIAGYQANPLLEATAETFVVAEEAPAENASSNGNE